MKFIKGVKAEQYNRKNIDGGDLLDERKAFAVRNSKEMKTALDVLHEEGYDSYIFMDETDAELFGGIEYVVKE